MDLRAECGLVLLRGQSRRMRLPWACSIAQFYFVLFEKWTYGFLGKKHLLVDISTGEGAGFVSERTPPLRQQSEF